MQIVTAVSEMQHTAEVLRREGKIIGVVPTMGYLHEGHRSLMRHARRLCDVLITTIFVNPTQFAPNEDFTRYPRDFEQDREICETEGTRILFAPPVEEMYPQIFSTYVTVENVSNILEGKFRPTHFRGVTTVVAKLFHITMPHVAVFGQKDIQQAFIIKKMANDLNLDIRIEIAPIVREADGLAMSSRNIYLNQNERTNAIALFKALRFAEDNIANGERSIEVLHKEMMEILEKAHPTAIDYVAFVDGIAFTEVHQLKPPSVIVALAVRFGPTRLIDNAIIKIEN